MLRKIAFRGKNRYRKEWLYGNLVQYKDGSFSIDGVPVETNSVGQFTGLYDKNGKEIYEGDIVNRIEEKSDYYPEQPGICREHSETRRWKEIRIYTITYDICPHLDGYELLCSQRYGSEVEVIGNRWDNPDLLNGK